MVCKVLATTSGTQPHYMSICWTREDVLTSDRGAGGSRDSKSPACSGIRTGGEEGGAWDSTQYTPSQARTLVCTPGKQGHLLFR